VEITREARITKTGVEPKLRNPACNSIIAGYTDIAISQKPMAFGKRLRKALLKPRRTPRTQIKLPFVAIAPIVGMFERKRSKKKDRRLAIKQKTGKFKRFLCLCGVFISRCLLGKICERPTPRTKKTVPRAVW
jgi:hypothetical protein